MLLRSSAHAFRSSEIMDSLAHARRQSHAAIAADMSSFARARCASGNLAPVGFGFSQVRAIVCVLAKPAAVERGRRRARDRHSIGPESLTTDLMAIDSTGSMAPMEPLPVQRLRSVFERRKVAGRSGNTRSNPASRPSSAPANVQPRIN